MARQSRGNDRNFQRFGSDRGRPPKASDDRPLWEEPSYDASGPFQSMRASRPHTELVATGPGSELMLGVLMLLTLAAAASWLFVAGRRAESTPMPSLESAISVSALSPMPEAPELAPELPAPASPEPPAADPALVVAAVPLVEDDEAAGVQVLVGETRVEAVEVEPAFADEELTEPEEADGLSFVLEELEAPEESRSSRSEQRRRRRSRHERAPTTPQVERQVESPAESQVASASASAGSPWWASSERSGTAAPAAAPAVAPAVALTPAAAPAPTPAPAPAAAPAPTPAPARVSGDATLDDLMTAVVTLESRQGAAPMQASSSLPDQPAREDVGRELRSIARQVRSCGAGVGGVAQSSIDFGSDGTVQRVQVSGVPGNVQSCVEAAVRGARVPPFSRATFSVRYPFPVQ